MGYLMQCKNARLADVAKVFEPLCKTLSEVSSAVLVPVDLHQVHVLFFAFSETSQS